MSGRLGVWQSVSRAGPRSTCSDPAEELWDRIEFLCQHIYRTSVNEAHLFATFSQIASHSDRECRSLLFLLQHEGTNSKNLVNLYRKFGQNRYLLQLRATQHDSKSSHVVFAFLKCNLKAISVCLPV